MCNIQLCRISSTVNYCRFLSLNSFKNEITHIWIDVSTENFVPEPSTKVSQTTFSKISSAHWYMIMTALSNIMPMHITILDK